MKKYKIFLSFIIALIILGFNIFTVAATEPDQVITAYFKALKVGDIELIKNLISNNLYNKKRVLLEKNPKYGNFLKKIYQDADIHIVNIAKKDKGTYVNVEINFLNGGQDLVTFLLTKDNAKDWKISEEITNP